jgi:hypothetical protein
LDILPPIDGWVGGGARGAIAARPRELRQRKAPTTHSARGGMGIGGLAHAGTMIKGPKGTAREKRDR